MANVDELIDADTKLTRGFMGAVAGLAANLIWVFFLATPGADGVFRPIIVTIAMSLVQFATYVWFAIAAGRAAKALGLAQWKYVTWILAAPWLALLPIPIVSTLIGVSPLSIKLLLGGQLQTEIRQLSSARA
jgi:hypothetical protein